MTLYDLYSAGSLRPHTASADEICRLLTKADEDFRQGDSEGLGTDWRFIITYTAALSYANAALAAAGYRTVPSKNPHENAISSLKFTVGLDEQAITDFHSFRTKRHAAYYERLGSITFPMLDQLGHFTEQLRGKTIVWLRDNHLDLIEGYEPR